MALGIRMTDDLIRILLAGGGLQLAANARLTDDLIRLAMAAKTGGGHLTLTGVGTRMTEDLVRISMAGRGHVTLKD